MMNRRRALALFGDAGVAAIMRAGALIDTWHCDASGLYSDEAAFNPGGGTGTVSTAGQKFLRGYQITDDAGQVKFLTIYPGWYSGRTIHIHVRVRTYSGATVLDNFTTQLFFDDTVTDAVLLPSALHTKHLARYHHARDGIYGGATGMLLNLTKTDTGYNGAITIGVNLKGPAAAAPAIAAGGIANLSN
jgi:hypothetical protein